MLQGKESKVVKRFFDKGIDTPFFLLLAQKKETKKKAAKNKCSAVFGGPTHMKSHYRLQIHFVVELIV